VSRFVALALPLLIGGCDPSNCSDLDAVYATFRGVVSRDAVSDTVEWSEIVTDDLSPGYRELVDALFRGSGQRVAVAAGFEGFTAIVMTPLRPSDTIAVAWSIAAGTSDTVLIELLDPSVFTAMPLPVSGRGVAGPRRSEPYLDLFVVSDSSLAARHVIAGRLLFWQGEYRVCFTD
jgi:hypothetical protein